MAAARAFTRSYLFFVSLGLFFFHSIETFFTVVGYGPHEFWYYGVYHQGCASAHPPTTRLLVALLRACAAGRSVTPAARDLPVRAACVAHLRTWRPRSTKNHYKMMMHRFDATVMIICMLGFYVRAQPQRRSHSLSHTTAARTPAGGLEHQPRRCQLQERRVARAVSLPRPPLVSSPLLAMCAKGLKCAPAPARRFGLVSALPCLRLLSHVGRIRRLFFTLIGVRAPATRTSTVAAPDSAAAAVRCSCCLGS
jgi:hypothetical protein